MFDFRAGFAVFDCPPVVLGNGSLNGPEREAQRIGRQGLTGLAGRRIRQGGCSDRGKGPFRIAIGIDASGSAPGIA
jgi:hypothetical protein